MSLFNPFTWFTHTKEKNEMHEQLNELSGNSGEHVVTNTISTDEEIKEFNERRTDELLAPHLDNLTKQMEEFARPDLSSEEPSKTS